MRVELLQEADISEFVAYCRRYGLLHDPSYLPSQGFVPDGPSCLLRGHRGEVIGAASLFKTATRGRFRILHSILSNEEPYRLLVDAILAHAGNVKDVYLFLPAEREKVAQILESLGFQTERYSFELERPALGMPEPVFPDEFLVRPLRIGRDEEAYIRVRNTCFSVLKGVAPLTLEQVRAYPGEEGYLDSGTMLLWGEDKVVGVVRVTRDEDEKGLAVIEDLAVLPRYQGRGVGKNLLRAAAEFARQNGLSKICLIVNVENKRAVNLYIREGFAKVRTMVCYSKPLTIK